MSGAQSISRTHKGSLAGSCLEVYGRQLDSISPDAALSLYTRISVGQPPRLRSAGAIRDHFGGTLSFLFKIILK